MGTADHRVGGQVGHTLRSTDHTLPAGQDVDLAGRQAQHPQ